jgi:glycerol-3-phosphate dehydrogenase
MWQQPAWRDQLWARVAGPWDLIVIGGGITGAGILAQAARLQLRVLLVEQCDFAWGASSRSSKFVHGGLRYLKEGAIGVTRQSVQERQALLSSGSGLVEPVGYLLPTYRGQHPSPLVYRLALTVYDRLGSPRRHRRLDAHDLLLLAPALKEQGLTGGFQYGEAQVDDARLTLRVLQEGIAAGGAAINYVTVEELVYVNGVVAGVRLCDRIADRRAEARAAVVVNATGAWADLLRQQVAARPRMRRLRGSHLAFPVERFPLAQALGVPHPLDGRMVTLGPWETVTVVGTTDVDHAGSPNEEPAISPAETAYLMAAAASFFPGLGLTLDDVVSTWAGVRPVINTGKADPSKEARDHAIWVEQGLLTVTGGKLTTFRRMALDALKAARPLLPGPLRLDERAPALEFIDLNMPLPAPLSEFAGRRLCGRYGSHAPALVEAAQQDELDLIPGTYTLWAELRWAARAEGVAHLADLLLRRTRVGLLLPAGGQALLPRLRTICQAELGWDDVRWAAEVAAYQELHGRCYGLPPRAAIPRW